MSSTTWSLWQSITAMVALVRFMQYALLRAEHQTIAAGLWSTPIEVMTALV